MLKKVLAGLLCLLVTFTSSQVCLADDTVLAASPSGSSTSPPPMLVPPPPATEPQQPPAPAEAPTPRDNGLINPSAPSPEQVYKPGQNVGPEYILNTGDILSIDDYSTSDLNTPTHQTTGIMPDGTINIHPIGIIRAAGMTVRGLTELVNQKAKEFLVTPDISISVQTLRAPNIYVLGEVVKPGLYSIDTNQAFGLTVATALQRAGGIKESADIRNIRVTSSSRQTPLRSDLWAMLVDGDISQDRHIESGDVIFVPRGGADYDPEVLGTAVSTYRRVRVLGAVRSPSLQDMSPDDDILSVLAKCGGFTSTAVRRYIILSRISRDGSISTERINMKRAFRDPNAIGRSHVRPGDLIIVADSIWKKAATGAYYATLGIITGLALVTFGTLITKGLNPPTTSSTSSSPGVVSLFSTSPSTTTTAP